MGVHPVYQAALVVTDLITAVLLFGQYNFSRSRGLFLLASGYLFTAFIAFAHALTFPGLFSPTGLLGAGPQSTAWLYMFWHGGFPLFVTAYAFLKKETSESTASRAGIVVCGVAGAGVLALAAPDVLAPWSKRHGHNGRQPLPAAMVVVLRHLGVKPPALAVLWSDDAPVLDLWIMVCGRGLSNRIVRGADAAARLGLCGRSTDCSPPAS